MQMPEIEEFMIFENDSGTTGIIIKNNESYKWWKCYKGINTGGQVFSVSVKDNYFKDISKLYKCNNEEYKKYYALKFMSGEYVFDEYTCVYEKNKKVEIKENPTINNYTINISVPSNIKIENIFQSIVEQLKNQIK